MRLPYRKIQHLIQFQNPVSFPTLPTFLFRSVLGKELRRLVCIFRGRPCGVCSLQYTCAYSWIFETPLETSPSILQGRDRGSHPFLLSTDAQPFQTYTGISLYLTVVGKAIEYYPYLYYALRRAGEIGILRERVPFTIRDVRCEGQSILEGTDSLNPTHGIRVWQLPPFSVETPPPPAQVEPIQVTLETPLRLRVEGRYSENFTASQFIEALWRRAQILCALYGSGNGETEQNLPGYKYHTHGANVNKEENIDPSNPSPYKHFNSSFRSVPFDSHEKLRIRSTSFRWQDYPYFSGRQKKLLRMGGVLGEFTMEGPIGMLETILLQFGELFHVGKNTAFGLGRYHFTRV